MKKLVIIPAYNESASIRKTVEDIRENAQEFDYVIINDCSTDDTMQVCRDNGLNFINLPVNLGIGGAVQTGYMYAWENGYDIAVQFDGDGQHNAKYLETMVECMESNKADMVIGSRFIELEGFQSSAARRIGIKYFTGLIKVLTGTKISDPTSGLRMINRDTIKMFANDYPVDYPEPESVVAILRRGKKVVEIPVIMNEREEGVSSICFRKSIYYMAKVSLAILIECIGEKNGLASC
ncbi:glycosyltransferase family 2 protein [Parasporobacterium paucivorans]|uniref:Glycosyltransferase 2-like domain-containing protein n=1 Tax=Parasporobacterium paucivorans DSM 15970 TaxID=1122934 RepID=A0A1M6JUB2_9FIRM|nr:glycosyltransferase family 2 protein [Parasporobacterium paucivorans]SHJ50256.1 hypothetical protein SAMN02745691_02070 [Parasporobacterium paucivorans DSM 15970]